MLQLPVTLSLGLLSKDLFLLKDRSAKEEEEEEEDIAFCKGVLFSALA